MRPKTAEHGAHEQQHGRSYPSVPLDVVRSDQLRIGKEIAVVAGQHHTGQTAVLQHPRRDGLAARLEGDSGKRHKDLPVQTVAVVELIVDEGDDESSEDNEQALERVGGDEDPTLARRKEAMEAGEEEGADAERGNGDECFDPAHAFRGSDDTETEVDRVAWHALEEVDGSATRRPNWPRRSSMALTCLHAHKGAPDEDSRAVEQTRDDVAEQQDEVCPVLAHIGPKVPLQLRPEAGCRCIFRRPGPPQQRGFLVGASVPLGLRVAVHFCGCCTPRCYGIVFYSLRRRQKWVRGAALLAVLPTSPLNATANAGYLGVGDRAAEMRRVLASV